MWAWGPIVEGALLMCNKEHFLPQRSYNPKGEDRWCEKVLLSSCYREGGYRGEGTHLRSQEASSRDGIWTSHQSNAFTTRPVFGRSQVLLLWKRLWTGGDFAWPLFSHFSRLQESRFSGVHCVSFIHTRAVACERGASVWLSCQQSLKDQLSLLSTYPGKSFCKICHSVLQRKRLNWLI